MTFTYEVTRNEEGRQSASVFADGRLVTADQDHPNFKAILTALLDDSTDGPTLVGLFDIPFAIGSVFEKLTDRVSASANTIYLDHAPIHSTLGDAILRSLADGAEDTYVALARFLDKLSDNPNETSRDSLYRFLDNGELTILPDGDFLAYKGVQSDTYLSRNEGTAIVDGIVVNGRIPYVPGSVVEMPRRDVDDNLGESCSTGLHVATFNFAKAFASVVVAVKVHPRDVVAVPLGGNEKVRVCRLTVLGEVTGPDAALVSTLDAPDTSEVEYVEPPVIWTGDEYRDARKALGLSLRALSAKTGVAKSYLGQIERGERVPSKGISQTLAEALLLTSWSFPGTETVES